MNHAFEIIAANKQRPNPPKVLPEPPTIAEALQSRMRDVLIIIEELIPEQVTKITQVTADEDVPEHLRFIQRIRGSINKEIALNALENKLVDLEWYLIKYHACRHDEGGLCDLWQIERSYGDVPEVVGK